MTLFTPQTFEKTLDIKNLEFIKHKDFSNVAITEYDIIKLKINKNDIPHEDFIIIKNLTLSLKLKTNNYSKSKQIYSEYFTKQSTGLIFKFNVDNDIYSIAQNIKKQFDSFEIITSAVNSLNPLYNAIEDLPELNIKLLDNYIFENGFIDNIQLNIATITIPERIWTMRPENKDKDFTQSFQFANSTFDFRNIFKCELKIEYSTTRF